MDRGLTDPARRARPERAGRRELLIPVDRMPDLFRDWNAIRHTAAVEACLHRNQEDRLTVDKRIGRNGIMQSVYCFDVTDLLA